MASPTTVLLPFFNDEFIDAITNGTYWRVDSSRTIPFAVANGEEGERWPDAKGAADILKMALQNVSTYTNLKFTYKGIFGDVHLAYDGGADIVLTLSGNKDLFPQKNIEAKAFFPYKAWEEAYVGQSGDMYMNINNSVASLPTYDPGSYGYGVLIHELGHALGLKHPHDDGATGRPTFQDIQSVQFDRILVTVMSYNDVLFSEKENFHPATYMILDVMGLQALYGVNRVTNAGDSQYKLTETDVYKTIWDAGGTDVVDASSASEAWIIVLPNERPSTVVPEAVGFAYLASDVGEPAPGTMYWFEGNIENAIGSRFADRITGNDLTNGIKGGAGNDTIDGGAGIDYSVYSGTWASATISRQGDTVTVKSAEGMDTLTNVERLLFSDQLVALDWGGNAGQGYRLYQAAFARTPDVAGLSFWVDKLDGGTSLRDVAGGFVSSNEFGAAHGRSADAGRYVDKFYQNVLGRPGEPGGVAYWTGELLRGVSVAEILVSFSESSENVARLTPLVGQGIVLDFAAFS